MDTNISYEVFEPGDLPVDESLLDHLTEEHRQLARNMMSSGYYVDGLYVWRFLNTDLTINLEKLELAVTLAVTMLESVSEEDITLNLRGLDDYYKIRGIVGNEKQAREERTFILTFVSAVASEVSKNDTLKVSYVR